MDDRYNWAALQKSCELCSSSLLNLYRHFECGREAMQASESQLRQVPRLSMQVIERILRDRNKAEPEQTASFLGKNRITVTTLQDQYYPSELSQIIDPPALIYSMGDLPEHQRPLLAMVGTRQATSYGKAVARQLARACARHGWGVVSGMARGIDTASHEGVLEENGFTMAFLGCGVDVCYPPENLRLHENIRERGCLCSEFLPGSSPMPRNFPIRNRLISGATIGTLVVEAGERSGALITAYQALDQGKEVFAVPGAITSPRSTGTNRLIKEGAKLVENFDDVLEEFPYLTQATGGEKDLGAHSDSCRASLSGTEMVVMKRLSLNPLDLDQLSVMTDLSVSVVGGILTMLEFKGYARRLPGHLFVCADITLLGSY